MKFVIVEWAVSWDLNTWKVDNCLFNLPLLQWSTNKHPCGGENAFLFSCLITFDKKLGNWKVELKPVQGVASTTSISPGSTSACSRKELPHRSCSQRIHRKSTRKQPSWMAESDLVYIAVQCSNSEGRHGTYRPRYHIFEYHERVRQSNGASVFALVPRSALDVEGWSICTLQELKASARENSFDLQKDLTRFQVATERCRNSCESAIRCRFLPPSGQPEGYRSCSLRTATCPRNNRQPVNSLETDRFEHIDIILIKQYCISHCIMLIVTFSVISGTVTVCMISWRLQDLMRARKTSKNTRPASMS